ncbi:type I Zorya anti-phage system protein ZorD [Aeromonas allosaccharophila]|uniref:type I Zorya anti-phage system protein ZorD n=1 Tax=Aeromonas allosaccharophila TaxID=656 RepID=UPI001BCAFE57|nr:type I Zorya anti-phage system protein ZorD [Aeromonas allosaccharophila]
MMLGRWFSKFGKNKHDPVDLSPCWQADERGIVFAERIQSEPERWALVGYLEQLAEEEYVAVLSDRWLLTWRDMYRLMADADHESSLALLSLPHCTDLRPKLECRGSLVDPQFTVAITHWSDEVTGEHVELKRQGALVTTKKGQRLLNEASWQLCESLRDLARCQRDEPGEATNYEGWAVIRSVAKAANADMDGFLAKTVVVKPQRLALRPRKAEIDSCPVIEVGVDFPEQPVGFLSSFDATQRVQDRYRITQPDGTIAHVLIEPEIKQVLEAIKAIPGRRVAGDSALSLLRNPYALLGEVTSVVLDPEQHEQSLVDAGIYFHHFRLEPKCEAESGKIATVLLHLSPISREPLPDETLSFNSPGIFAPFVQELRFKLAAGMSAGFWQGFELELGDFDEQQLLDIEKLLDRWQREVSGELFDSLFELSRYGDRIIGLGEVVPVSSPFLTRTTGQDWLSSESNGIEESVGDVVAQINFDDAAALDELSKRIDEAFAEGAGHLCLPGSEQPVPLRLAEQIQKEWRKQIRSEEPTVQESMRKNSIGLLVEENIDEVGYAKWRQDAIQQARLSSPSLPERLKPEISLREHQLHGVAWLQHLFELSPEHVSGCLLADDMGLGKTIQLLTFVVDYLERQPSGDPVLIVAPVSLLDNWEAELRKFFYADDIAVMRLYGDALSEAKFRSYEIPESLRQQGVTNLLRPGWLQEARIVLTTYETLRSQEISLGRQSWAMVICDEAQKIKNPAAMVTRAIKAMKSRFRIACTGTPVENTLIDLWSLFDFVQPGLLGALNQFGREYQKPIEEGECKDLEALARLRSLIEPQTLRRTKQDVAKDLPSKIEDRTCRNLTMVSRQRSLYNQQIGEYRQRQLVQEAAGSKESFILPVLHKLKLVCAHPYCVEPDLWLREHSPKMRWLLEQLDNIRCSGDKVIIFTELRDVQREVQHAVKVRFDISPTIINGDTSTSSDSLNSRQRLIDRFQAVSGFNVIILSTVAVGFGVNVQGANHVIHFTRCWNPAKEDQATDRAYRIGQTKDVFVYYPTIRDADIQTFEATLDDLLDQRRSLASDMLQGKNDLQLSEFDGVLNK